MSTATTFPSSLLTATPAEGHQLARQLAAQALAERIHDQHDMAAHLSSPPPPTVEALTAVYFQTVASANGGWVR